MHVCICVHVYMCICVDVYLSMCICICDVYMCMCVYVCMCICVYVYMCICVYVYECNMYVCMYVRIAQRVSPRCRLRVQSLGFDKVCCLSLGLHRV